MTTRPDVIDSHTHIFLPERYPYSSTRQYTPGLADVAMLENHLTRIGASRVVVVQPSPYGTDNRATLQATKALGKARARAIAVVDPRNTAPGDLRALANADVVGLRVNLKTSGVDSVAIATAYLRDLGQATRGTELLIQVFLPLSMVLALRPTFVQLGRPVILDHFAGLKTSAPNLEKDLAALADLLTLPNMILKASGSCRVTGYAADASALDTIAPRLFDAAPGRVIWGSDWPHTGKSSERASRPIRDIEPFMAIDDRVGLDDLARWAGNPERLRTILQDTPASLFGF